MWGLRHVSCYFRSQVTSVPTGPTRDIDMQIIAFFPCFGLILFDKFKLVKKTHVFQ